MKIKSEVVFLIIIQRVTNFSSDNYCKIWKKYKIAVPLSSQWACKMKLAHEFALPPLLLLNQNRDFDLEANSFYKPFKFIVLFMLNPNLNQEGADTLITTHFRQDQLPWQVEKAISIAPEGEMRDML